MYDMKKIIFLFILTTCYVLLATQAAYAAGMELGIDPPILQIEALPPSEINSPIVFENQSEEPLAVVVQLKPFKAAPTDNGEVQYLSENEPMRGANPNIFQRIQLQDEDKKRVSSFTIGPRQKKSLVLSVRIPKNEPASDYYFAVLFLASVPKDQKTAPDQENFTTTSGGIGTNVLLSIGPKGNPKGVLEVFSVPFFLEGGPVPFRVKVRNDGNYYTTVQGNIVIKNMFGQRIGNVELLPVNVLAGSSRFIPDSRQIPDRIETLTDEPASKREEKKQTDKQINRQPTAVWNESFLLGPYTATLTMKLSDKGPVFVKAIYFFALPMRLLFSGIIMVFIVLLIRKRLKKRLASI